MEELDLVERAKRGDAEAYEALVRRYQDSALRLAYAIIGLGRAELLDDLAFPITCPHARRLTEPHGPGTSCGLYRSPHPARRGRAPGGQACWAWAVGGRSVSH